MKHFLMSLAALLAGTAGGQAQTLLIVEVNNYIPYHDDVPDPATFGSSPAISPGTGRVFQRFVFLGDIVSINGQPAKGLWTATATNIFTSPNPPAKQAIADVVRQNIIEMYFDLMQSDGTPLGTIMATGLTRGSPAPGAPLAQTGDTLAIVGGTGAFLGLRGQAGVVDLGSPRQASVVEDPADRRSNGGAKRSYVLHLIPLAPPEIALTAAGPAIVHSGTFTLVNGANPARPGETLTLYATGLGPTRPGVDPGNAFAASGRQVVNSPVQIMINGTANPVSYAGGYPGSVNGYQVNFQLPDDAAPGNASLSLSVAWIKGSQVQIPVR